MEKASIKFTDFTFKYYTQQAPTLHEINLEIRSGEKVLIIGASGSGKSTLGHCLNGLIPYAYKGDITGSLEVGGSDTREVGIYDLSKNIGTVIQDSDAQFVGQTVGEDMAFAMENDNVAQSEMIERVKKVAGLVGMDKHLKNSPYGISGGQKQRTALAGVLVDDVDILLFDEPLANLDPKTGKLAMEIIEDIHKNYGKTVIIIEHRLEDVLHIPIDRIILVADGRIIADMDPKTLFMSGLLEKYGIREPLYISALKYAGVDLDKLDLARVESIDMDLAGDGLKAWYAKREPHPQERGNVLLSARDLHFSYDGNKENIKGVSFDIYEGEMLAIAGTNGAGKSTVAKLICGFEKLDSGSLTFEGQDLTKFSIKERADYIGYVMQNPNQMISKAKIYDEVALGLRLRGFSEDEIATRVDEVLKICGLYEFIDWPISALSYGQKKRVTIASILVLKPKLLILDEPTAGQDHRHYTEIMTFLEKLNALGVTVMIITHDMHLMLEYTQRCLVFNEGLLVAQDSPSAVLSDMDIIDTANLAETSLIKLAKRLGIEEPRTFVQAFVDEERKRR